MLHASLSGCYFVNLAFLHRFACVWIYLFLRHHVLVLHLPLYGCYRTVVTNALHFCLFVDNSGQLQLHSNSSNFALKPVTKILQALSFASTKKRTQFHRQTNPPKKSNSKANSRKLLQNQNKLSHLLLLFSPRSPTLIHKSHKAELQILKAHTQFYP
ncbi:hypothetical protein CY35_15G076900 [Sphagnum magellanicum]|nr:hypothetical protein CY35_15G076900 [Sphagnum magellanicum]